MGSATMKLPPGHGDDAARSVGFAILTVSDSRTPETDRSGELIAELIGGAGHRVAGRELVADEPEAIVAAADRLLAEPGVQILVATGGTGVGPRDRTVDALGGRFERTLPGFGELFRALSFEEIGAAAMLSRAVAGLLGGRAVFLLPGSPAACRLAMEQLILPQAGHLVALLG